MPTGEIEVLAQAIQIYNSSKTPPFYINEEVDVDENLLLKYRYLHLRRSGMRNNMILRHKVIKFMRDFLDAKGFVEVETPILIKSTPKGARDYVVPSRMHAGKFYALPQSPQQLKQLLMVAGLENIIIARCFRDEDCEPTVSLSLLNWPSRWLCYRRRYIEFVRRDVHVAGRDPDSRYKTC